MRVDLIPYCSMIKDYSLKNKTVIIIDLLRATSTIVTALENGAFQVIPVDSVSCAEELAGKRDNTLMAGEREGIKIKGFSLGNSPLEFSQTRIGGKTIVHCTTNGTRTMLNCSGAENVLIGSLLNRAACIDFAAGLGKDLLLVCAGRKGGPAQEDSICAGAFVQFLRDHYYKSNFSKLALEAYYLYKISSNKLHDIIYRSPSGQNLISIGLKKDIDFCLRKDIFNVVPILKNDVIQSYKEPFNVS